MTMQMDAGFKKEQDGKLFLSGGGTGRGVWGVGGPSGVSTPKSIRAIPKRKKHPPGHSHNQKDFQVVWSTNLIPSPCILFAPLCRYAPANLQLLLKQRPGTQKIWPLYATSCSWPNVCAV